MNRPGSSDDGQVAPPALPRHARRLADKPLVAFYADPRMRLEGPGDSRSRFPHNGSRRTDKDL